MDDIFGISTNAVMAILLAVLALCSLTVAWGAIRHNVIFKLGVRNIPRRREQSGVVVLGLMLSTLIIAAALGTGDTVDHSVTSDVETSLGSVDEVLVSSQDSLANIDLISEGAFPADVLGTLETTFADGSAIDGLLPMLDARAAVVNTSTNLAEPDIIISGVDPERLGAFGGLTATDGSAIDLTALAPDEVVLSESLAIDLDATPGHTITIHYANTPTTWTVAAIAEDSYLSGTRRGEFSWLETSGLVLPLGTVQAITGQAGMLSAIAVSNTGGEDATDEVVSQLTEALAGQSLGVDPIRQDRMDTAERTSTAFTSLFLILGLFSISAGILLIVLIFTMLAAERRAEMGMERAIGTHRRQLVQQFVSEGSVYAILAGLVGSALGVVAAVGIATGMRHIFGEDAPIEPMVTARTVIISYCAGVAITFATVVVASWRVSRINIVAAVRDIPDIISPHRSWKSLAWGILLMLLGGFLTIQGIDGSDGLPFMTGMSLMPFGIALVLRFFQAPARITYSTVGIALLVFWLLPDDAFSAIFGHFNSGLEMYFVSGIVLVIATTLLIVNNLDLLLAGLSHLGKLVTSILPALRTAIAYPSAARGRTGMTIAMFSLIVFSLVMTAAMNTNYAANVLGDEANAGWHVRADMVGGTPLDDFEGTLQAAGVDTTGFVAVGVVHSPTTALAEARVAGSPDPDWKTYPVFGMETSFLDGSRLRFGQRAAGYETDAAVIEALRTDPNVAVIDTFAVPQNDEIGANDEAFLLTGLSNDDTVFEPITVELLDPADGSAHEVTIIGVLDAEIGSLYGLYAAQPTIDAMYPTTARTSYYITLDDPETADQVARDVEAALLTYGVSGISIRGELEAAQAQESGFLYILEGFMGLGLLVGVAAVGVISFRSVVERRQQIGVMRALGYQRRMVALSFLFETAVVVGVGGLAGTVLGLLLSRNLLASEESGIAGSEFLIPWGILLAIMVFTNAAALLMTWIPATQAGRIAPAEALRYE